MLKIQRRYNQFQVSVIGERFSIMADNLEQVNAAVAHYYGHPHESEICPTCKVVNEIARKARRKMEREEARQAKAQSKRADADGRMV